MKFKNKFSIQLKRITLFSVIMLSSILACNLAIFSNYSADRENINDKKVISDDFEHIDSFESPKLSVFGYAPWWDSSYEYRMLINVTNPYPYNINNFGVNLVINYADLISAGKIQSDLDDIRIVEMKGGNGILRNYYVVKDYPTSGYATIFFDTNISDSITETDTYLYCGNPGASNAESDQPSETFGWVKNGDFELDIDLSDKFEPYGWYFSHNPVNEIKGVANPSPNEYNSSDTSYQLFVNKLINTVSGGERIAHGSYAYKWGTPDSTLSGGNINDYAGTFFTYPFTVPNVPGRGISLQLFRNIRTYRFEEPKNPGTIDKDGYFIRILNGSNTVYSIDPDLHDDNNISHSSYSNYAEAYDGHAYYNPSSKKWTLDTYLKDFPAHTLINDTNSDTSADGDLTGYIEIDLTPYMGKEVFFEIGVWGDESNVLRKEKDAYFQVDDLAFNYTLTTSINEVQARKSDITVNARDIDGNIVPNAHIIIIDEVSSSIVAQGYTSTFKGSVSFYQLLNGEYNITANYTLGSREAVVGHQIVELNGTSYVITLTLTLWTIDFEIVDWDGIPLSLGSIEINNSLGGGLLDTLTLDQDGKATFRWLSTSDYYFRVYYENEDYIGEKFLLNESYISRSLYEKDGNKFQDHILWVNNTNTQTKGVSSYSVSELFYSNGSRTEFGNKKIIKINISLTNMGDQLSDISIYYVDKDNSTGTGNENLIYFEDGYTPSEDSDFIELDIPSIENAKLESESFEIYGFLLEINGVNSSRCDGVIDIRTTESCNIFNRTHLARLNIRVIREEKSVKVPYPALIKVVDNKNQQPIVNLTSRLDRDGYAYTSINDLPFWFLKDRAYNISINSLNVTNIDFNVTYISPYQWHPTDGDGVKWYNYTLYGGSSIEFNLIFKTFSPNITNYVTSFFNATGISEVQWGQDMSFSIDFYITDDNGETWNPIMNPSASCNLYIRETGKELVLYSHELEPGIEDGHFNLTIDSSKFSAGEKEKYYTVTIQGSYPGYPEPSSQNFLIKITAIPTIISAHDYGSYLELPAKTFTTYYDEIVNITIQYSFLESGNPIHDAILRYEWIGLNPINFYVDPLNNDYYTFTIDTADAQSTGLKIISIKASLENHTSQSDFLVYLNILERRTTLNDISSDLLYISSTIYVQDQEYFNFTYKDTSTNDVLGDLSIATYVWEELYENGTKVPNSFGSGALYQNLDNSYILDFKTVSRPVGYYFLYVSIKKDNYVQKNAFINLVIKLRTFVPTIELPHLGSSNQIQIKHGTDIDFEISLWDETRNEELENATIKVNYRGNNYDFNPNPLELGSYNLTLITSDINTFITAETFVAKITIEAANFTTQEILITITVRMEEIFPGMPTFYFILITSSIVGVAGSLIAYRVIQQARIPKHVKKIRKIKSLIKSKKKITEIPSIPTKEQMIAKIFGNDWKEIDLSIDEVLGIQPIKPKKLPKKEKTAKEPTIEKIIEEKAKKEKELKKRLKKEEIKFEKPPAEQELGEELPEKALEEQKFEEELPEEEVLEEQKFEEELPEEEVLEEREFEEKLPEEEVLEEQKFEEELSEKALEEKKSDEEILKDQVSKERGEKN